MTTPEHIKARKWREALQLSRSELAKAIGYSAEAVKQFETGCNRSTGEPLPAESWRRYRNACAGAFMVARFDWDQAQPSPQPQAPARPAESP